MTPRETDTPIAAWSGEDRPLDVSRAFGDLTIATGLATRTVGTYVVGASVPAINVLSVGSVPQYVATIVVLVCVLKQRLELPHSKPLAGSYHVSIDKAFAADCMATHCGQQIRASSCALNGP